uniref:Heme-binding protein soul2 n=1 Tax=Echeneis naucrates TaxID=173247 RepID=A0A665UB49_ECHNA
FHCNMILILVLVLLCRGWEVLCLCDQQQCPEYHLVGFEERLYISSNWISTKVESPKESDVMAAHSRLKDFCQKASGSMIPTNTWPVLITVSEGENGPDLSLSWFLPPGTRKPENTDSSVTIQTRPEATIYVRIFGGIPTISNGQQNVKMLREDLIKAGKAFNPHTYTGAGYDSYFSLTQHNEIWIYAA